jgi:S-adenosylmethionine:tRNA ribosyltransferase-isomerase
VRIELFDYHLPADLVAQSPPERRDESRLLSLARGATDQPSEYRFAEVPELLREGDVLIVNDAMVAPQRLHTKRTTGGAVEILLLQGVRASVGGQGSVWEAMIRGGKRLHAGEILYLDECGTHLMVHGETKKGRHLVELPRNYDVEEVLKRWGQMPLPPYIQRYPGDEHTVIDRERYQTVYAREPGAIAAPTAGLHFTQSLLKKIERVGVKIATLTLKVGTGTFQPVRVSEVAEHRMESEPYVLPDQCVDAIVAAKANQGRVIGVGTTVVRTLEHAARASDGIENAAGAGNANIFIYPGFGFHVVDAMLTNFHLPRSTPILMAAAFAGRERLLQAYEFAVRRRFRFYSYGDAMLIT